MGVIASQINSLTIVYSIVYSDADQKKTSKLCVIGLCTGNSTGTGEFPHKLRKMFSFDDVIMHKYKRNMPDSCFTLGQTHMISIKFRCGGGEAIKQFWITNNEVKNSVITADHIKKTDQSLAIYYLLKDTTTST